MNLLGMQRPQRLGRASTTRASCPALPDSASLDDTRQTGRHSGSPVTLCHTGDGVPWSSVLGLTRDI